MAAGLVAVLALAGFLIAAFPGAAKRISERLRAHTTSEPAQSAANNTAATPAAIPAAPAQPNASAVPAQPGAPVDGVAGAPGVAVVPGQPGVAVVPVPVQPGIGVAVAPTQPAPADNSADQGPLVIPAGTVIAVRLSDPVDSSMNQVGDKFGASVDSAVDVNGTEAIPAGSDASVTLINLAVAPIAPRTDVQLQLVSLTVNGTDYTPRTSVFEQQSIERNKKKVIAGAAIGATFGGIFGHGGGQGAAQGAASGAAKPYVVLIPAQTRLKFTLRRSITLSQ
jgi:hypothetical protein